VNETSEKYIEKTIWFLSIIFIIFPFVIFFLLIVWLLWEWEPFSSSKIKTVRFLERVVVDKNIYHNKNEFSFIIDENNGKVYQKLISPIFDDQEIRERNKKIIDDFLISNAENENNLSHKKETLTLSKFDPSIKHLFPHPVDSIIELKNCVVISNKDWICEDHIKFTNQYKENPKFGMIDGDWTDPDLKKELYKTKLNWFFKNYRCGNSCFIMTEAQEIQEHENAMKKIHEMVLRGMDRKKDD
jgi:hypothetical protein